MPPDAGIDVGLDLSDTGQQARNLLRWPDVLDGHGQEFLAAIAVAVDRGSVDVEEGQCLSVINPHRLRIRHKHLAVAPFALL